MHVKWPIFKNISLEVANGFHYLHIVVVPRIVHQGITSNNITLDDNLEPKIGGFERAQFYSEAIWKGCWALKQYVYSLSYKESVKNGSIL